MQKNHNFTYSPILLAREKNANPPNLAKPKPNQSQFLLQPNFSHLIFYASLTIPYQDCTNTITALIHQFCYQGKKSLSTELGYGKTQPRTISFATKLFTLHFLCSCDNSRLRFYENQNFTYSPILLARQKKVNPPNLAKPKPNQYQFLLQPNFSHFIFDVFVTIPYQYCTETITSLIHQFCYQGKKSQSTEFGYGKTQPRSISFATKLFTPHFLCICDNCLPRLHKNHNFTYSPILLPRQKKPIHRTWLSQNPTKINSFCNQTFHTSFFMHL